MDLPIDVLIHNTILGLKGTPGTLLRIAEEGFFEVNCRFGDNVHRVLLPIGATAVISKEAEEVFEPGFEVER